MKTVKILIGVPGVGKSTYVQNHLKENSLWLSSDNIRVELFGDLINSEENNKIAWREVDIRYKEALKNPNINEIFYDATNINRKRRSHIYSLAKSQGATVEAVCFLKPLSIILKQNSKRTGLAKVPNQVILNVYRKLQPPRIGVDCDSISKPYGNNFHEFTEEIDLDLPHDSSFHLESIREHINLTIENAKRTGNSNLVEIATFHDLGKFICKEYIEKDEKMFARYLGHNNLSAMYYLSNLNLDDKNLDLKLNIMEAINQHMTAHNGFSKKVIERNNLTPDVLKLCEDFAVIDSKSKFTSEAHPDFQSSLKVTPVHFNFNKGVWEPCKATKRNVSINRRVL